MNDKNLISIETQSEYSATSGEKETRIFLKMYVEAVHSGLIADMGAERWQTLCVIAAFMNKDGECFPTQFSIAKRLNVKRETANRRIKALCEYRWQGRQLVVKVQARDHEKQTWDNVRYTIKPISGLTIFDDDKEPSDAEPNTD
ncbi:helix-turn-helix domain-containing protein [Cytobacillus gottheilii]|uniref:Helix-turn-helix domain-containing protein n=1 Tax=Cytobacillus gottheilii TaxID=859144 RepID=A0ABX8FG20_9BACI|nr:helix-turn-helix domain-containing protein [Cytobacillus gottheilii]QVY62935.1 helix-turn-helix domain-containing protein [Cytobacillus gottheilii]